MTSCKTIARSPVDLWTAQRLQIAPEELSQERLIEYQLAAARNLITYLKENSRFYEAHLKGMEACDIRSMQDFQALPTTSETDLIGQEWKFQCVHPDRVRRVVTVPTTGTHGQQKRISFTENDLRLAMAFAPTGFSVMCEPGDKVLVMMSGGRPGSIGDNVARGLEPMQVQASVYGEIRDLEDAATQVCRIQPDVLVGVPQQMAALAGYMKKNGMHFQTKSVLLSADDVPEAICQRLRRNWNCHTFRHYGMTELCMFGAVECLGADGYHMRACDHLFEIDRPDANGYGEILVTTLHHEAMPLLRYRTGDIGRMTTSSCACGSPLQRIETIRGRKTNAISLPKGELFLRDIAEAVYQDPAVVDFDCMMEKEVLRIILYTLPDERAKETAVSQAVQKLFSDKGMEISCVSATRDYQCKEHMIGKKKWLIRQ
ncbi:MAG: phenylacetate--CoA ligase family protein [Eubacterium sp.]|nr:phenylacetate--CoA ligase family protein [Eubacterium sp.]